MKLAFEGSRAVAQIEIRSRIVNHSKTILLFIAAIFVLSACAGQPEEGAPAENGADTTPEGEIKRDGGKADAWNWRNDPARFRTE